MANGPSIYGQKRRLSLSFGQERPPVNFTEFACATCRTSYVVQEGHDSACPLCRLRTRVDDLEEEILKRGRIIERQTKEIEGLSKRMNLIDGLQESASEASPGEIAEIGKMIARLFRVGEDGPASLGPLYRKGTESPVGFLLASYQAEPVEFRCYTVGGVSLAMRYADILRSYGSDVAEKALARVVGSVMDNSVNIDKKVIPPDRPMPWE